MQATAPPAGWPEDGVVATAAGLGMSRAAIVGGGAGASDPWPKCHVHEAVACVPAGCM